MDEPLKKVSIWQKILILLSIVTILVLSAYFVNSCSKTITGVSASDLIGCTYYSKEKNYIINFYSDRTMNYVDSKDNVYLLLEYESKDNVVLANYVTTEFNFVIIDKQIILYERLNKLLFLME